MSEFSDLVTNLKNLDRRLREEIIVKMENQKRNQVNTIKNEDNIQEMFSEMQTQLQRLESFLTNYNYNKTLSAEEIKDRIDILKKFQNNNETLKRNYDIKVLNNPSVRIHNYFYREETVRHLSQINKKHC
jgi:hypothetical protein